MSTRVFLVAAGPRPGSPFGPSDTCPPAERTNDLNHCGYGCTWLKKALDRLLALPCTIVLIGGTDLLTTTLEPHEFLDFLRGRLAQNSHRRPATTQSDASAYARPRRSSSTSTSSWR